MRCKRHHRFNCEVCKPTQDYAAETSDTSSLLNAAAAIAVETATDTSTTTTDPFVSSDGMTGGGGAGGDF